MGTDMYNLCRWFGGRGCGGGFRHSQALSSFCMETLVHTSICCGHARIELQNCLREAASTCQSLAHARDILFLYGGAELSAAVMVLGVAGLFCHG